MDLKPAVFITYNFTDQAIFCLAVIFLINPIHCKLSS